MRIATLLYDRCQRPGALPPGVTPATRAIALRATARTIPTALRT